MFVSGIFHLLVQLYYTYTIKKKNLSKRQLFMLLKNRGFHLFRAPNQCKKPPFCTTGLTVFSDKNCTLV